MKFNIAYPRTGAQKMYNIDDEHKWGKLVDRRMGNEFEGEILGDEFKGYMFKITGGTDNDGFPMKQGILVKGRVRLILEPESHCFVCRKDGAHRRKAVRGCIVGTDMSCVSLLIVKKGDVELEGLTDQNRPRRLGPKRANKIRKMFTLPKHSDNANKKEKDLTKVVVDHWDVTRYVVRRQTKEVDGKAYFKVPKVQRLVTPYRIRRKRVYRTSRVERAKKGAEAYSGYITKLKGMKEIRRARSASGTGRRAPTN
jgi:small subunit ribosomal protein S6e